MADYYKKYKSLYASTANTFGTGTGVTITPSSVAGLPTDTEITLTFDRVDSGGTETPASMERIIGTISGGNFVVRTSPSSGRGADGTTDQAHTSPVVEHIWNAKDLNDMVDGFLVQHTQAGAHSNLTASTVNVGSTVTFTGGVNDATMSANSATLLATQQSIKTYVDDTTKTIVLPAGSMSPTTTAGCATIATIEATTNDVDYRVLAFDKDSDESAFIVFSMPDSWDGGTITFQPYWTSAGTSGTVVFSLAGRSFANDEAIDQAYGTPQTSTDTFIASGDVHIGPTSSAITLAGTPAGGELVQLKITRDVSEDTLDADARLIAIKLEYGLNAHND